MSDSIHPLTLWLARASMACYTAALMVSASRRSSDSRGYRHWRVLWSAACVLLIVHVLAAFHFEHDWSHAHALNHTAKQTARVTGINWGGGLYFNYAFLMLWLADVILVWCREKKSPTTIRRTTDLACIFMVINATAVFGPTWWFWTVAALALLLIVVRYRSSKTRGCIDV